MSFESERREGKREKSKQMGGGARKTGECQRVRLFCYSDHGRGGLGIDGCDEVGEGKNMLADAMV